MPAGRTKYGRARVGGGLPGTCRATWGECPKPHSWDSAKPKSLPCASLAAIQRLAGRGSWCDTRRRCRQRRRGACGSGSGGLDCTIFFEHDRIGSRCSELSGRERRACPVRRRLVTDEKGLVAGQARSTTWSRLSLGPVVLSSHRAPARRSRQR